MLTSRRKIIKAISAGGILLPAASSMAALPLTPPGGMGPFYPVDRPLDQDADMTRLDGHSERASGKVIEITGRTLYADGTAAPGVMLDIWQANAAGRYSSALDENDIPLDPHFQSSALISSGDDGTWRLLTILPGTYPTGGGSYRTRHIHWDIRDKYGVHVTQSYFPGEPLNETDSLYSRMGSERARKLATFTDAGKRADGVQRYAWDIVVARPSSEIG